MKALAYRYPIITNILLVTLLFAAAYGVSRDIDERDERGRTALMRAAEAGALEEVESLLGRGADVNARDDCRWSALLFASQGGHRRVVARLLDAGADVMAVDKAGYSAVMVAAMNNHATTIRHLLERGASLDAADRTLGWGALHWAAKEGHLESVSVLLAFGADPHRPDSGGITALDWARRNGHDPLRPLMNGDGDWR